DAVSTVFENDQILNGALIWAKLGFEFADDAVRIKHLAKLIEFSKDMFNQCRPGFLTKADLKEIEKIGAEINHYTMPYQVANLSFKGIKIGERFLLSGKGNWQGILYPFDPTSASMKIFTREKNN